MAFPEDILDIMIEMYVDGAWVDITSYVYTAENISISRGGRDESSSVDPTLCRLTLNNRDGRFSSRNPLGPYFGKIGRNTQLRVSVANGPVRLRIVNDNGNFAADDSAALSVSGDIELQVDSAPLTWRPQENLIFGLIKVQGYYLTVTPDGLLRITWWDSASTTGSLTSTVPIPGSISGRKSLRVTLDVDNGSGGHTGRFYSSDDSTIDGSWVLFDTVTGSGTTSIYDGSTKLICYSTAPMEVYALKVVDGIGGTEVANPDFTAQTSGVSSFDDAAGNTWEMFGTDVGVDNMHFRFWGEVARWPQTWDITGRDVRTPIEAASIRRRLISGSSNLQSAMRRSIPNVSATSLVSYWPIEDGADSQIVSAVVGNSIMRYRGAPSFASHSGFVCSSPVVSLGTGRLYAPVDVYDPTGEIQFRFLAYVPSSTTGGTVVAKLFTSGSAAKWEVVYGTGGALSIRAYDNDNVLVLDDGPTAFDVDDKHIRIHVAVNNTGSDVYYVLAVQTIGIAAAYYVDGTLSSEQIGRAVAVDFNPAEADVGSIAIGHVTVESEITTIYDLANEANAYFGELAATRVNRLCTEEGIPFRIVGGGDGDSEMTGYQTVDTLINNLNNAAIADNGVLYEPRDGYGLQLRTLSSMTSQDPTCTVAYTSKALQSFYPVEDDQTIRNDVTVSRNGGSSFRAVQESGPMSVQQPPDGVGRYSSAFSVSLARDASAEHQAGWRLHLGTVDEARYPVISVSMASAHVASDQDLVYQLLRLDVGDRFVVTDPPSWMPPDDVSQLVRGYSEVINQRTHDITFTCVPESPYHVAVYDDDRDGTRFDGGLSTLASDATSTATALSVATSDGPLWTTDGGEFPLDVTVSGERITVTAVSGSSSPQTFTVTRSVNGIVKALSSGDEVSLFRPTYYSLNGAAPL
ncbi:MAG: hypothetical protein PVJ28_00125 [Acidimicrobiia bacterium]|jgi:hypothetical protein